MPSKNPARTKSAPRPLVWWAFLLLLTAAVMVWLWLLGQAAATPMVRYAHVGTEHYTLEIVRTPAAQQHGLGDRSWLPQQYGMLFAYTDNSERCFWMKDMHFPLDMIWLNAQRQIVGVAPRVAPDSYPQTYCHNGQYVLELNAGEVSRSGVQLGQALYW